MRGKAGWPAFVFWINNIINYKFTLNKEQFQKNMPGEAEEKRFTVSKESLTKLPSFNEDYLSVTSGGEIRMK